MNTKTATEKCIDCTKSPTKKCKGWLFLKMEGGVISMAGWGQLVFVRGGYKKRDAGKADAPEP